MDGAGKTKSVVLGLFATLCFLSCICGFVVYNVINKKKRPTSANKRLHRRFGNLFLATTLLFAFSGAWHAFAKVGKSSASIQTKQASFASDDVKLDVRSLLQKLPGEKVTNVSLVRIDDENYWQVSCKKENKTERKYIHVASGKMLAQGDEQYSRSLVSALSIASHNPVKEVKLLTAFNHQYSMMNKRLPVVENRLTNGDAFYIDPATGSVAAVSNSSDAAERFSFRNLHMYHFWEMWLGKTVGSFVKNLFLIGSTLGLLAVALSGVLIYTRRIARRS
ncbi:MAG: PepSY domain-containing protein [Chitinophagaceae bacterium]|nr:MAG: PepSY domain-containing protein [Chitinophagaceae bacterium]